MGIPSLISDFQAEYSLWARRSRSLSKPISHHTSKNLFRHVRSIEKAVSSKSIPREPSESAPTIRKKHLGPSARAPSAAMVLEVLKYIQSMGQDGKSTSQAIGNRDDSRNASNSPAINITQREIIFRQCRPHASSTSAFHLINRTAADIPFSFSVLHVPSAGTGSDTTRKSENTLTDILQEKPFFKQVNMKFDPAEFASDDEPSSRFQTKKFPQDLFDSVVSNGNVQFSVTPAYGTLDPFESVKVNVRFRPASYRDVHAVLLCKTPDPHPSMVYLLGRVSRPLLSVHPKNIDFGTCLCDQVYRRTIKITNFGQFIAHVKFENISVAPEEGNVRLEGDVLYGCQTQASLAPGGECLLEIMYLPKRVGKYAKTLLICSDNEVPTRVTVSGKSAMQAVKVDLPRRQRNRRAHAANSTDAQGAPTFKCGRTARWEKSLRQETTGIVVDGAPSTSISQLDVAADKGGEFLLDLGLHSTSSSKICHLCKISNPGELPLNFTLLQNDDPLRKLLRVTFSRQAEIPPGGYLEIRIELDPKKYRLGQSECPLTFAIRNGQKFVINCRVTIEEPQISVRLLCGDQKESPAVACLMTSSREAVTKCPPISFGSVRCGYSSSYHFQLVNSGRVANKWSITCKPPNFHEDERNQGSQNVFEINPTKGSLEPGQKTNVRIEFFSRDVLQCSGKWIVRLKDSTHRMCLRAEGRGILPTVEPSTDNVTFDHTFPYMAGNIQTLTVRNPCPFPIDIYCKELDTQYLLEEDVINTLEDFDSAAEVKLPVRAVGGGLPAELLEYYNTNPCIKRSFKPIPLAITGTEAQTPLSDVSTDDPSRSPECIQTTADIPDHLVSYLPKHVSPSLLNRTFASKRELYGTLTDASRTPLQRALVKYQGLCNAVDQRSEHFKRGFIALIHGPPACGKSALARKLSKCYKIPIVKLNDLVMQALESPVSETDFKILNFLVYPTSTSSSNINSTRSVPTPPEDGRTRDTKPKVVASKNQIKPNKTQPGKNQSSPMDQALNRPDNELGYRPRPISFTNALTDQPTTIQSSMIPEDLLVDLITTRLSRQDCRKGVIFDDLRTDFCEDFVAAARAILKSVGDRKRIYSFVLLNSFADLRKAKLHERKRQDDGDHSVLLRKAKIMRQMSLGTYTCLGKDGKAELDVHISAFARLVRHHKRTGPVTPHLTEEVHHPVPKRELSIPGALAGKHLKAMSAIRVAGTTDNAQPHEEQRKAKLDHSEALGVQKVAVRASSARFSVTKKLKPGTGGPTSASGQQIKPKRDCWALAPRHHADSSNAISVYRTELYRGYRAFYATLKSYDDLMSKWAGLPKNGSKKTAKKDIRKDLASAGQKKKPAKSNSSKTKTKEISEAERLQRDKAAVERAKAKCSSRRSFGVKHIMLLLKNIKSPGSWIRSLKLDSQHWSHLPDPREIDETTREAVAIPSSKLFCLKARPLLSVTPVTPGEVRSRATPNTDGKFMIVVRAEDQPAVPVSATGAPVAHPPVSAEKPPAQHPGQSATARQNKADARLRSTRSASKTRTVASAMPRSGDSHHTQGGADTKPIQAPDLAATYPFFNKAKALGESSFVAARSYRWSIPAYGSVDIRISFQSEEEGSFFQVYTFAIVDTLSQSFTFRLSGRCNHPDLFNPLPEVFPTTIWVQKITDEKNGPVFVPDDMKLYFGPLISGKKKADVLSGLHTRHVFSFILRNPCRVQIAVHLAIPKRAREGSKDKTLTSDFTVVPEQVTLPAAGQQIVQLYAHPAQPGVVEELLNVFMEYNPAPTSITLSCLSVKPQAEVVNKNVIIEKVPIRDVAVGNIEIRNKMPVLSLKWRLIGTEALPPEFSFDHKEGILAASTDVQHIPVRFSSAHDRPLSHMKKPLKIEFLTDDREEILIQTEQVSVSGESYDLILDITFPKSVDSVLDFGVAKVNEAVVRQITLKNKGKSDCGFNFHLVFDEGDIEPSQKTLLQTFIICDPPHGVLTPSDRPLNISLTSKAPVPIDFKGKCILHCFVHDPLKGNQRVAEIPIKVNVTALYSKFSMSPLPGEMRFPCGLPLQKRSRTITLQNMGTFEINYQFKKISSSFVPGEKPTIAIPTASAQRTKSGQDAQQATTNTGQMRSRPSVSSSQSKQKEYAVQQALALSAFVIRPMNAVIKPGEMSQIVVEHASDLVGTFEEVYELETSDRDPGQFPGALRFVMSGETAVPTIDVKLENFFMEHTILPETFGESEPTIQRLLVDRSIFLPKKKQFLVQHTFVGTKRPLRFRLTNTSNIACPVSASLKSIGTVTKLKIGSDGFVLHPNNPSVLEPHQSVFLTVLFSPALTTKCQMSFELMVEMPFVQQTKVTIMAFEMQGEGVLSSIKVLKPAYCDKQGQLTLRFPKTAIDVTQDSLPTLPLNLYNEAPLPVTLRLRMRDNQSQFMIKDGENEASGDAIVCIPPCQDKKVFFSYHPITAGKTSVVLELLVEEGVSPIMTVTLKAEAVKQDFDFKGLPIVPYDLRLWAMSFAGMVHEDNIMERFFTPLRECLPESVVKLTTELVNKSVEWTRFEWPKLPEFVEINPRAGHLKPQSSITLSLTYKAGSNSSSRLLPFECLLSAFSIPDNYPIGDIWHSDKQSLQVMSDIRRPKLESDLSSSHSGDKLDADRDLDYGEQKESGRHDRREKKGDPKKAKEKKAGKKDSVTDKHRKATEKGEKPRSRKASNSSKELSKHDIESSKESKRLLGHKDTKAEAAAEDTSVKSTTDVSKDSVSDPDKKVMAPTPEPAVLIKPESTRSVAFVISSVVGYASYQCSIQEALFADTFVMERRTLTFTLTNTGNIAFNFTTSFSESVEECVEALEQVARCRSPLDKPLPATEGESKKGSSRQVDDATFPFTARSERSEKGTKQVNTRAVTTQLTQELQQPKESTISKRKRRVSKDSTDGQPSPQTLQTSRSTGNKMPVVAAQKILLEHYKSMTSEQSANLTKAFQLEPTSGNIAPTCVQTFTLTFEPDDCIEYLGCLFVKMDNLNPRATPLVIPVHAIGKLPILHVKLPKEDTIKWTVPNNEAARRINVAQLGLGAFKHAITLSNPTSNDYEVAIHRSTQGDSCDNAVEFVPNKLTIAGGKQAVVELRGITNMLGSLESYWNFASSQLNFHYPLVVTTVTRDPLVYSVPAVLQFKPMLCSVNVTRAFHLVNDEDVDLRFSMDMEHFQGFPNAKWKVVPSEGILLKKQRTQITVTFNSTEDMTISLYLQCRIEKLTLPLRILLDHDVKSPKIDVVFKRGDNTCRLSMEPKEEQPVIDFGQCEMRVSYTGVLTLTNHGSVNAPFSVSIINSFRNAVKLPCLDITPAKGLIKVGKSVQTELKYRPMSPTDSLTAQNLSLMIEVEFGGRFEAKLTSEILQTDIQFSFDECDFGPVIISRDNAEVGSTVPLVISNRTARDVVIDLLTHNLPPCMGFEFSPITLAMNMSSIHAVMFLPTDPGVYSGSVTFLIGGTLTKTISFKGEGVSIELTVPIEARHLLFTKCQAGQTLTRVLSIINKTKATVRGTVLAIPKSGSTTDFKSMIESRVFRFSPAEETEISPDGECKVKIQFSPVSRLPPFEGKFVFVTSAKLAKDLATFIASCPGKHVVLEEKIIDFGPLVVNKSLTRKVMLRNNGELAADFHWTMENFGDLFSIRPRKGTLPGKEGRSIEVTFHPKTVNASIRVDANCEIPDNPLPLKLHLTASCVPLPPAKDAPIVFDCAIRGTDTKLIPLTNPSNITWEVRPEIKGSAWSGPTIINVGPNSTEQIELIFKPMTGGEHIGQMILTMPTSQVLVYNLLGKTSAPKPTAKIVRDVPCRQDVKERLSVFNALDKLQTFQVAVEYVKPEKPDPAISVSGRSVIHVPASSKAEYQFGFRALRDKEVNGVFIYKVHFRNPETEDYQWYEIQYKVVKGAPYDSRTIVTTVRTLKREVITITNPLETQVTLTCTLQGTLGDVQMDPTGSVILPPKRSLDIMLDYFPLRSATVQARIDLASNEMGPTFIELNLHALPSSSDPVIQFDTPFGSTVTQTCRIHNHAKARADFTVRITEGAGDFQLAVDKSNYSLQPGSPTNPTEQTIDVVFDPSQLGKFSGKLVATSAVGGEFVFLLSGVAAPPRPKGPYAVLPNGEVNPPIEFRNPYTRPLAFNLVLSNKRFLAKETTEVLKPKKTITIPVSLASSGADLNSLQGTPVYGKLSVTPKLDNGTEMDKEAVEWLFYLKTEL